MSKKLKFFIVEDDFDLSSCFNSSISETRKVCIAQKENKNIEKKIFLQIIDFSWRSHLQYLEQLRQVIGLRQYGQKDHLSEFKKEAFVLFEGLLTKINILIDKNLDRFEDIFAAAGHPNCIFKIDFDNLVKITKGAVKNITE
mgnify:CR=1 FL=1